MVANEFCQNTVGWVRTLVIAIAVLAGAGQAAIAQHADQSVRDEVLAALNAWVAAVASGDMDRVDAVLAPEFQIQRANGIGYDRETYLTSNLPRIADLPVIDDLVVTIQDNLAVTRYALTVDETIDGVAVLSDAPRLTILRHDGDQWLIVAHANFSNFIN